MRICEAAVFLCAKRDPGLVSESVMREERNDFLLINKYRTALMGFAALWILIFHEWVPVFEGGGKLQAAEEFVKRIGFCGVDIFLFLSGIGMTYAIKKTKSLSAFYYKRLKRILFPFIAVAIVSAVLEGWPMIKLLKYVSGAAFYLEDIYLFLWFVPAVLTLYLLFPLYYHFFERASNKIIFSGCILLVWLLLSNMARGATRADLYGFTNRIPIFLIGILMGYFFQNRTVIFDRSTWIFLGLMLVLGLYLEYLASYTGMYILVPVSDCCVPNILIAVSLSFLLCRFLDLLQESRHMWGLGDWLIKIFGFYGKFTLELYCIQELAGERILPGIAAGHGKIVTNLIFFVIVTVMAFLMSAAGKYFWRLIDGGVGYLRREKQDNVETV